MWLRTALIRTYTERVQKCRTTCAAPRTILVVLAVVLDLDNLDDVDR